MVFRGERKKLDDDALLTIELAVNQGAKVLWDCFSGKTQCRIFEEFDSFCMLSFESFWIRFENIRRE